MAHTPGPWMAMPARHSVSGTFGVKTVAGDWIAKCHPFSGDAIGQAEAEANARLIAAAPDLLAVVRDVVRLTEAEDVHECDLSRFVAAARAAIAAAEGS